MVEKHGFRLVTSSRAVPSQRYDVKEIGHFEAQAP